MSPLPCDLIVFQHERFVKRYILVALFVKLLEKLKELKSEVKYNVRTIITKLVCFLFQIFHLQEKIIVKYITSVSADLKALPMCVDYYYHRIGCKFWWDDKCTCTCTILKVISYHHLNCLHIKYILKAPEATDIGYHVHKTLEYQYTGTYIYILKFASK